MKLSTKGRYGTRVMLDLAQHYGKGPILLKDISLRQNISEKYLWHLITPLKNAGFVNSTRGINGGYELAKAPKDINLKDIITVLEGPIELVDCMENSVKCQMSDDCVSRDIWHDISERIGKMLGSITLAEMVERQRQRSSMLNYTI